VWHRHFRHLFLDVESNRSHTHSTERLGRALNAAREQR
jgi:hypothetical protein